MGWAYSAFRMRDLMQGVLETIGFDQLSPALRVEVYDGDRQTPDTQLFALEQTPTKTGTDPSLQAVRQLAFGGHQWSLVVTANPEFEARRPIDKATLIAIGGGIGSLVLALFIGIQTYNHLRIAAALADEARLNEQLAERERDLLWAQQTANLGSWTYDRAGRKLTWSEGMFRIWGLDPARGAPTQAEQRSLIHPDDRPPYDAAAVAAAEHGRPYRMDLRVRRPGGEERTVVTICTPERGSGRAQSCASAAPIRTSLSESARRRRGISRSRSSIA